MYFYPDYSQKNLPKNNIEYSNELFDKLNTMKYKDVTKKTPEDDSTQWVYLQDCVGRGTVTPMEAYDSINLGYVPTHLTTRKSLYVSLSQNKIKRFKTTLTFKT